MGVLLKNILVFIRRKKNFSDPLGMRFIFIPRSIDNTFTSREDKPTPVIACFHTQHYCTIYTQWKKNFKTLTWQAAVINIFSTTTNETLNWSHVIYSAIRFSCTLQRFGMSTLYKTIWIFRIFFSEMQWYWIMYKTHEMHMGKWGGEITWSETPLCIVWESILFKSKYNVLLRSPSYTKVCCSWTCSDNIFRLQTRRNNLV